VAERHGTGTNTYAIGTKVASDGTAAHRSRTKRSRLASSLGTKKMRREKRENATEVPGQPKGQRVRGRVSGATDEHVGQRFSKSVFLSVLGQEVGEDVVHHHVTMQLNNVVVFFLCHRPLFCKSQKTKNRNKPRKRNQTSLSSLYSAKRENESIQFNRIIQMANRNEINFRNIFDLELNVRECTIRPMQK
jgi:hypothetical protein